MFGLGNTTNRTSLEDVFNLGDEYYGKGKKRFKAVIHVVEVVNSAQRHCKVNSPEYIRYAELKYIWEELKTRIHQEILFLHRTVRKELAALGYDEPYSAPDGSYVVDYDISDETVMIEAYTKMYNDTTSDLFDLREKAKGLRDNASDSNIIIALSNALGYFDTKVRPCALNNYINVQRFKGKPINLVEAKTMFDTVEKADFARILLD